MLFASCSDLVWASIFCHQLVGSSLSFVAMAALVISCRRVISIVFGWPAAISAFGHYQLFDWLRANWRLLFCRFRIRLCWSTSNRRDTFSFKVIHKACECRCRCLSVFCHHRRLVSVQSFLSLCEIALILKISECVYGASTSCLGSSWTFRQSTLFSWTACTTSFFLSLSLSIC